MTTFSVQSDKAQAAPIMRMSGGEHGQTQFDRIV